jgi:hypothetical protein
MKRLILLLLTLSLFTATFAQVLKERRVYYLDCSFSMVTPNKIWDKVCDNLINAIENVEDETTELIVVPFAFDNQHHNALNAYKELSTPQGKANLKNKIRSIKPNKSTMTYHSDALKDFYNNRIAPDRVNYMFFMTDGQNEEKPDPMPNLLKQWGGRYQGKNVYGFYVMLHNSAGSPVTEGVIESQPQLWKVKTADVNINLIRLQNHAVFNARNDKYFDLPIYGKADGKNFSAAVTGAAPYNVSKVEKKGDRLRIYLSHRDVHQLPVTLNVPLKITMTGGGPYDFLVTETVNVKCESKPERSLKITVRQ